MEADAALLSGLAFLCFATGFTGSYLILWFKKLSETIT